jgi:hypothetical protein
MKLKFSKDDWQSARPEELKNLGVGRAMEEANNAFSRINSNLEACHTAVAKLEALEVLLDSAAKKAGASMTPAFRKQLSAWQGQVEYGVDGAWSIAKAHLVVEIQGSCAAEVDKWIKLVKKEKSGVDAFANAQTRLAREERDDKGYEKLKADAAKFTKTLDPIVGDELQAFVKKNFGRDLVQCSLGVDKYELPGNFRQLQSDAAAFEASVLGLRKLFPPIKPDRSKKPKL